jgi:hypothetical protein
MYQRRDSGAKCFGLVRSDPNQIPIRTLQAARECGTEPRPGANADTPFVYFRGVGNAGKLELSRPEVGRRIFNERLCEIALDTTNEVVFVGLASRTAQASALHLTPNNRDVRYSPKCMVLQVGSPRNSGQQPLLHSTLEAYDGYLGRRL